MQPDLAEGEDERQGERDAGEVRGDAGERHQRRPEDRRQAAEDDRVGQQEPEDRRRRSR